MSKIKEEIEKIHAEIHKTILEKLPNFDKYKIIPYIARWAAELKYKEEYKDLLDSERINIAIHDFLTGKVTIEDIKKLPPLEARKKFALTSPTLSEEKPSEKKESQTKKKKK